MKTLSLILIVACMFLIGCESVPETGIIIIVIDGEITYGQYGYEENIFVAFIPERDEIQTGGAVIKFQYNEKYYQIEIPTKARVTLVVVSGKILEYAKSGTVEDSLYYSTRGFGQSRRLSRIKLQK